MWSKRHNLNNCLVCKSADYPHEGRGLCRRCYNKLYLRSYRKKHDEEIKAYKHQWYIENVQGTDKQKKMRDEHYYSGLREDALRRDSYTCQKCGSKKQLVVHHLDGKGRSVKTPHNTLENLQTLCRACHAKIHSMAITWARYYDACVKCGTTERKHNAKGFCWLCYSKQQDRVRATRRRVETDGNDQSTQSND